MNPDIFTLVTQLNIAKKFYYDGKPIMTDAQFDQLEAKLRQIDANNEYFKTVGAPAVRGTKIKHKIPMGSLIQVDDIVGIYKWHSTPSDLIVTDKLDGNSVAVYYDENGDFESAVTRGDGIEGLDITRHVRRMLNRENPPVPAKCHPNFTVRLEAIIRKDLFEQHVTGYKNPRNYVAGQLNRAVADQTFIDYVDLVAFDADLPRTSKEAILLTLVALEFNVVHWDFPNSDYVDEPFDYQDYLALRKANSPYELDGLVIDIDRAKTREDLGYDGLYPKFAVKYKINVNFVETEVVAVEWNPSKDGYMKPRVQFEPIDLAGVTINFATGFNAKFILDNKIGPGAKIQVTRSGDVIPYISQVIQGVNNLILPDMSVCHWTDTGVDLVLNELPDESVIKQIAEFFANIDAPMLKQGNVTQLYEAGFTTIESIIKATEDELMLVLGENGTKVFVGLRDKLSDIDEYVLAGSLPFFGRGVGKRKIKALVEAYGDLIGIARQQILDTPGFEETTADKIVEALPKYVNFIDQMRDYISVRKFVKIEGDLNGISVCFTGVRSKPLEDAIEKRGGKVLASATSTMTHLVAKDPTGKSGKLDKARKAGVEIISLEQAEQRWIG